MACEQHVWARGRPNFVPKTNMMVRYTPPTPEQLADPTSTVNIFTPVKRVEALGDEPLKALFPGAASDTITRHSEAIDMDKTPLKSITTRPTPVTCASYGDLVLANMYASYPNPNDPYDHYGTRVGRDASA